MDKIVKQLNNSDDPYSFVNDLTLETLEELYIYTNEKYRNDNPVIDDSIYDMIEDFLRLKNPKNKNLKKIGAIVDVKKRVELDYYLGSMDKIKPPSKKLAGWKTKYKSDSYIASDKLDGVSGLLVYRNSGEINLYTRGTATHGMNITPLLKYFPNIPPYNVVLKYCSKNKIKGGKNLIAFRGELIISKKIFQKNWSSKMKNARNTVSGIVNSKNVNPLLAADTRLVMYEVVDPNYPILEQFKIIKDLEFDCVHFREINDFNFTILSKYLVKRKGKSKYVIDGIIITNNKLNPKNKSGNPDYTFAFKDVLDDQKANTTIIDIEWKKSKDGYINPTIIIEPVNIGGVTIKRATANNAKFVVDNKLGKGAEIEIIRSGDVIPKIQKVLKNASKVDLPDGNWDWSSSGVDIICKDLLCKEVIIKNIYYFFSVLGTKGLGERIVEKLYDTNIDSIKKVLSAKKEDFLNVDGFKDKSAEKLVTAIKTATTNKPIELFIVGSNKLGHGMGLERVKSVLDTYPNIITEYSKWSKSEFINKLKDINGWEEKTSTMFANNFSDFIKFFNNIKSLVSVKSKIVKKNGKYKDQKIVLSGTRDKALMEYLESEGAILTNTISKNIDILIIKDESVKDTTKVKKAEELGIKIYTKDYFKI